MLAMPTWHCCAIDKRQARGKKLIISHIHKLLLLSSIKIHKKSALTCRTSARARNSLHIGRDTIVLGRRRRHHFELERVAHRKQEVRWALAQERADQTTSAVLLPYVDLIHGANDCVQRDNAFGRTTWRRRTSAARTVSAIAGRRWRRRRSNGTAEDVLPLSRRYIINTWPARRQLSRHTFFVHRGGGMRSCPHPFE